MPFDAGTVHTQNSHGDNGQCKNIPADATALSLNVTALDASAQTYLTFWPADAAQPNASSVNIGHGQPPAPNAVTADVAANGQFKVFNETGSVNVLIDVNGYFVDHNHDDRYYTQAQIDTMLSTPQRELSSGRATTVAVGECVNIFGYGAGPDSQAGKILTGHVVTSAGDAVPTIGNYVIFRPGVIYKSARGGTLGYVEMCNPQGHPIELPAGWRLVPKIIE